MLLTSWGYTIVHCCCPAGDTRSEPIYLYWILLDMVTIDLYSRYLLVIVFVFARSAELLGLPNC